MTPMGIYYTLAVTLVIWIGLFLYLLRLDRRVSELEAGD
jgi:CcmD family protein